MLPLPQPPEGGEVMALEGWEIVQADSRHISIKHPDGTWATIADTGPINNMMFYELCLAILKAQEQK